MKHKHYRRTMEDSLKEIEALRKADIKMPKKAFVQEHKKLLDVLEHPTKSKLREEAEEQSKELKVELNKGPVRSPRKGHTIAQLERLKEDNWHNPDTGTEIHAEEGQDHLNRLHQNKADKKLKEMIESKKTVASTDSPEDLFGKGRSLAKAPYQTEGGNYRLQSEFLPVGQQKNEKHVKSYKLPGNLFHHVFSRTDDADDIAEGFRRHVLSASPDPKNSSKALSHLEGRNYGDTGVFTVGGSTTHPELEGKGYATRLYESVLGHHGKMNSGSVVSGPANRVWEKLRDRGLNVELGQKGSVEPHKALAASERLIKAPIEYADAEAKHIAEEPIGIPKKEYYKHTKASPVGDNLWHHVYESHGSRPFSDDNDVVHQITNSPAPWALAATRFAEIVGTPKKDGLSVDISQVHPKYKGQGFGKLAYEAALAHHGKLYSDELVSPNAQKVWEHLKTKGADVQMGKPDTRERNVATIGQQKKLVASEMSKGSRQKKTPFKPGIDTSEGQEENIASWQHEYVPENDYDDTPPSPRDSRSAVHRDEGNIRERFLRKLSAKTKFRRAPDGKVEFLLHRGGGENEPARKAGNHWQHDENSSWTSSRNIADGFGPNKMSAWIHEDNILTVPNQYGKLINPKHVGFNAQYSKPGENKFKTEHEVIVGPHSSEAHPWEGTWSSGPEKDINARITARGKESKSGFYKPNALENTRDWARAGKLPQKLGVYKLKKLAASEPMNKATGPVWIKHPSGKHKFKVTSHGYSKHGSGSSHSVGVYTSDGQHCFTDVVNSPGEKHAYIKTWSSRSPEEIDQEAKSLGGSGNLEKASKNVREQRKKIFGTDANAARTSEKRMKMMQRIRDYSQKKYGLPMVTASGKRNASGKLREEPAVTHTPYDVFTPEGVQAEKELGQKLKQMGAKRHDPKPDWRSGALETQPSPDAAVHEAAHLDLAPEGMTAPQFQEEMDRLWGESQSKYGHMQQKKTRGEVQPMAIENPIRRELGLPANVATKPVSENQPVLDDPDQKRFVEAKDPKTGKTRFLDRQSRLQNPETTERRQQIKEGSLKFHPDRGWYRAADTNALINLRGRGLQEEAKQRLKSRTAPVAVEQPKDMASELEALSGHTGSVEDLKSKIAQITQRHKAPKKLAASEMAKGGWSSSKKYGVKSKESAEEAKKRAKAAMDAAVAALDPKPKKSEDKDLKKMSRPRLKFPKMGIDNEEHNVKNVGTPRQKELMTRETINEMNPKDVSRMQETKDKGGMDILQYPSVKRFKANLSPTKQSGGNIHITSGGESGTRSGGSKQVTYAWSNKMGLHGKVPKKDKTDKMKIESGKHLDQVRSHEAAHRVMYRVGQIHGNDAKNKVLNHLIEHALPNVEDRNILFGYTKHRGYNHRSSGFNEEMINTMRDVLTHENSRDHFNRFYTEGSRFGGPALGAGKDPREFVNKLKHGWNKLTQRANEITHEDVKNLASKKESEET